MCPTVNDNMLLWHKRSCAMQLLMGRAWVSTTLTALHYKTCVYVCRFACCHKLYPKLNERILKFTACWSPPMKVNMMDLSLSNSTPTECNCRPWQTRAITHSSYVCFRYRPCIISARNSAHDFIMKLSPSVCSRSSFLDQGNSFIKFCLTSSWTKHACSGPPPDDKSFY